MYYGCYDRLVQIMEDYLRKPVDSMPDCFYTIATYGRVNMHSVVHEVLQRKIENYAQRKANRRTRLPIQLLRFDRAQADQVCAPYAENKALSNQNQFSFYEAKQVDFTGVAGASEILNIAG